MEAVTQTPIHQSVIERIENFIRRVERENRHNRRERITKHVGDNDTPRKLTVPGQRK